MPVEADCEDTIYVRATPHTKKVVIEVEPNQEVAISLVTATTTKQSDWSKSLPVEVAEFTGLKTEEYQDENSTKIGWPRASDGAIRTTYGNYQSFGIILIDKDALEEVRKYGWREISIGNDEFHDLCHKAELISVIRDYTDYVMGIRP